MIAHLKGNYIHVYIIISNTIRKFNPLDYITLQLIWLDFLTFSEYLIFIFSTVMSAPKKARRKSPRVTDDDLDNKIQEGILKALPSITAAVQQGLKSNQPETMEPSSPITNGIQEEVLGILATPAASHPCTDSGLTVQSESLTPIVTCTATKPLDLGIDPKNIAKIVNNEYLNFGTLIPKSQRVTLDDDNDQFRYTQDDKGQLILTKSSKCTPITSIRLWYDAFHVFVGIYCKKHPDDITDLMSYSLIISHLAKECGDNAALAYDDQFRRWREKDIPGCPWAKKNGELYHEAIVSAVNTKLKPSGSFRPQQKNAQRKYYCYSYNNNDGKCVRGKTCKMPHLCQFCFGPHPRNKCPTPRPKNAPSATITRPNSD